MKELIPKDELGVFADNHDTARVDSLFAADSFGIRHKQILRDIRKIIAPDFGLSEKFIKDNFKAGTYKNGAGRMAPCYYLTRDGFFTLALGYTDAKAVEIKEIYIARFDEIERTIKALVVMRRESPLLAETIRLVYENPKPYHFSNECDMLNRIVLGMSAKQFRLANGIEKGKSIRPYMTEEQVKMLETLQKIDAGLLVAVPDYQQRKRHLEWYVARQKQAEDGH